MSATRPDALAIILEDLRTRTRSLEADYKWLYPSGYEGRRGGRGGNGGPDGADLSRVTASTETHRRLLERAARKVAAAKVALVDAGEALGRLADLIDEGESKELPDLAAIKQLGSWEANRAAGEAAADRRALRGATLPGSDYGLPPPPARAAG